MRRSRVLLVGVGTSADDLERAVAHRLAARRHRVYRSGQPLDDWPDDRLLDEMDVYLVVITDGADPRDLRGLEETLERARRKGLGVSVFVQTPADHATPVRFFDFAQAHFSSRTELLFLATEAVENGSAARTVAPPSIELTLHPPAERPGADDAGVVVSEVEGLLVRAERFVADDSLPEDVRDEVDTRRRQLRDELRLIEQGKGRSAVLTGISGVLLDLVRPVPADDDLGSALDEVADGIVSLGRASSDEERVAAGEEVVAALDHVGEEIAGVIEANGWDDLKASMWRTAGAWVEEDFRPHLNAFITAARERALPAGTGAVGGAAVGLAGGPPWLAVTIVAAGLLRSLFPWIFPRRTPPAE